MKRWGGTKALIVYGGGSAVRSGLLGRVEESLEKAGIAYAHLGGVQPNPRLALAEEGVKLAVAEKVDFVLAVGGGSSIDTAKAIAHGAARPECKLWDLWMKKEPLGDSLPVGCVVGSASFVIILKKIKEQTVLITNCLLAFVAITVALLLNKVAVYFVCLAIAGFFIGVLFSIVLAIATRIGYKRISVTSSYVATVAGASDILTPIITGAIVGALGVGSAYYYVLAMLAITAISGMIVKINTSEKNA